MSHVTNLILSFGAAEHTIEGDGPEADTYPVLAPLNAFLAAEQHGRTLVDIGHHAGGYKAMEAWVFGFAANYISGDRLLEVIRGLSWEDPESVQVWIKEQEDEVFTEHRLIPVR